MFNSCNLFQKKMATAGSMKELAEEKAKYGGVEEKETPEQRREDYYVKTIQFECRLCGLCEMCQYLGTKPPFTKNTLEFTEECYVMLDPFKPRQSRWNSDFLVLGGTCSMCRCCFSSLSLCYSSCPGSTVAWNAASSSARGSVSSAPSSISTSFLKMSRARSSSRLD